MAQQSERCDEMLAQAREFLELLHHEMPSVGSFQRRWDEVRREKLSELRSLLERE